MFRKIVLFLVVFTTAAFGLSTVSKRKTYTEGQTFTAADYNADKDEIVTWVNALNAKFPGTTPNDSTKTTLGVFDTLLSIGGVIRIKSYLLGVAADDSLVFDNARLDTVHGDTISYKRAHLDTVRIDSLSVVELYVSGTATFGGSATQSRLNPDSLYIGGTPIVGFTLGATAGERSMLAYVIADTFWVNTRPVVGFAAGTTAGKRVRFPYVDADTLRGVDTLNATAIRGTRLHLSSAPVGVGFADFASAGVRLRRAYADVDTLRGVDTLNAVAIRATRLHLSAAPVGASFSDFASAGVRMRRAMADIDTIRTDSLTAAGPATFLPGVTVKILGTLDADTVRVDCLTVVGPSTFVGAQNTATATDWKLGGTAYTGTMANINTLRDDSMADALHRHSELSASDGTPNGHFSVGATGDVTLSDGYKIITGRAHPDSLYIGGTPIVGFALAQTAGTKAFIASLKTDSLTTDSLTVMGPATVTGQSRFSNVERIDMRPDSARIDWLDTTITANTSAKKIVTWDLKDSRYLGRCYAWGADGCVDFRNNYQAFLAA
ncbi:MAG: hypothetical protein NUW01_01425, partial [Gemmatimonadaceae bacterium]|nr:hypothetical protein [Gemmatimonadaceae bacterium]